MPPSSDARSPVELLADEFLARCKRGEKPTIKEYCDRRPDVAEEIRDVFEAVLMVEELRPGSSEFTGSSVDAVQVDGKEPDFNALCGRADFQKLVVEVEANAEKN
jgi:hypothetical protein